MLYEQKGGLHATSCRGGVSWVCVVTWSSSSELDSLDGVLTA